MNAPQAIDATAATERVSVLLPLPLAGAYTYRLPPEIAVTAGDYVAVPLGSRVLNGVVWGAATDAVEEQRLKPVLHRLDVPPMPEPLRRFVDWVAAYTLSPPGAVLRMCMSVPDALTPAALRTAWMLGGPPPARMTPARQRILDVLAEGPPRTIGDLAQEAGVSDAVVRGLIASGTLHEIHLPPLPPYGRPAWDHPGPALSPAQDAAAAELRAPVREGRFEVTLLEGVTGSGKTEVYFEAIAEALKQDRQVMVLLPEIALTAQWLDRFEARFGTRPAEWHSDLRPRQRRHAWRSVADGSARVVVGARSALFLPFPQLGLIVIDEEHDQSFKQEEGVIYNARDMAVVRAKLCGCSVILSSATPALETLVNAEQGRYRHVLLPDRHAGAAMPIVEAIDLRRDPPPSQRFLSPRLIAALRETLEAGEQSMLFLNRRGYAPLTLCGACGHRLQCPHCTAWLVEHRFHQRLQCHHCGYSTSMPPVCTECGAEGRFKPCGPGVERLAEEVAEAFPEIRFAVMASDTVGGPRQAAEFVRRVNAHEIDLLIGTQIVAKGFHFPLLTLVGVVDADLGLAGGDLRAAERTHQLLTQVAGRAGRARHPGRVLLQTFAPEHPVIQALVRRDSAAFLAAETAGRRNAAMPPYGRLAALILSGPNERSVADAGKALARAAPRGDGITVLGPAPAPMALLRGNHRQRLLLKAPRNAHVQAALQDWLARVKVPNDVRLTVDVDPYSFL
jgi:primosomal protein N' (replication factor Y)